VNEDVLARLAANAAAGTPCALATVVRTESPTSAHPGDAAVITADGAVHGWVGGSCSEPLVRREALRAIADGQPRLVRVISSQAASEQRTDSEVTVATTCPSGGALEIFVDPQLPPPLLVVMGQSPAARTLLQMGSLSGFRTCAVHPGARAQDFPGAGRVLASLEEVASLAAALDVWVVVATMGHYDDEALAAALGLPQADVSLVASERRAAAALAALRLRAVDEAQIARVRTPAGTHRGATQEEIALHALDDVVVRRRARLAELRIVAEAEVAEPFVMEAEPQPEGGEEPVVQPEPAVATAPVLTALEMFAVDPVCGMTVDITSSTHHLLHGGVTYHFCCVACAMEFQSEPARFTAAATA